MQGIVSNRSWFEVAGNLSLRALARRFKNKTRTLHRRANRPNQSRDWPYNIWIQDGSSGRYPNVSFSCSKLQNMVIRSNSFGMISISESKLAAYRLKPGLHTAQPHKWPKR